ncbi:MAG: hypothetical protein HY056_05705 [Proteobacteria bacterium]|nr:hypothetical protein [Pseudomonadota bacterium]
MNDRENAPRCLIAPRRECESPWIGERRSTHCGVTFVIEKTVKNRHNEIF